MTIVDKKWRQNDFPESDEIQFCPPIRNIESNWIKVVIPEENNICLRQQQIYSFKNNIFIHAL